ncbi:MAG: tail fiber protein [Nanoarchaeota archaeon]
MKKIIIYLSFLFMFSCFVYASSVSVTEMHISNDLTVDGSYGLQDDDIPYLPASKITSGTFSTARIPNLPASKITSGTFSTARIPNLPASKITRGTFSTARLPTASTSSSGIVRLSSSTSSTSTTLAATSRAVRTTYNLAASKAGTKSCPSGQFLTRTTRGGGTCATPSSSSSGGITKKNGVKMSITYDDKVVPLVSCPSGMSLITCEVNFDGVYSSGSYTDDSLYLYTYSDGSTYCGVRAKTNHHAWYGTKVNAVAVCFG